MKFFGNKFVLIAQEAVIDRCPNCGAEETLRLNIFQKCFYAFFIPVIPHAKKGNSECTQCKQVLEENRIPGRWYDQFTILKRKGPKVWMFSGLLIMPIVFNLLPLLTARSASLQRMNEYRQYIENPRIEDLYEVKQHNKKYVLLKTEMIIGDTVYFRQSRYQTPAREALGSVVNNGFYEEIRYYLKSDLKKMLEDKVIVGVRRRKDMK